MADVASAGVNRHLSVVVDNERPVANTTPESAYTSPVAAPIEPSQPGPQYASVSLRATSKINIDARVNPMDAETQRYVDLKADVTRAQNDARFAEVLARLDKMPSVWAMGGMFVASTFAVIGALLAFLAYGGDRFDGGMSAASVSLQQAEEARKLAKETNTRMDDLDKKLGTLIDLMSKRVNQ